VPLFHVLKFLLAPSEMAIYDKDFCVIPPWVGRPRKPSLIRISKVIGSINSAMFVLYGFSVSFNCNCFADSRVSLMKFQSFSVEIHRFKC